MIDLLTSKPRGQSFLALVLFIGAMIALIGIGIAFFAGSFVDSGYGYQAAAIAGAAAASGAEDALLQLNRNGDFSSSGYSLVVASTTVTVAVGQNTPATNLITITSTATFSSRTKVVSVLVGKDASTTQMTLVSWQIVQ